MSENNISGERVNKAIRVNPTTQEPFSYVSGSLDLSNLPLGTYYFNTDNNLEYTKNWFNYPKFTGISDTIVAEVVQYGKPEIVTNALDTTKDYTINSTSLNGFWTTQVGWNGTNAVDIQYSKSTSDASGNIYVIGTYFAQPVTAYSTVNSPVNIPLGANISQIHSFVAKYAPNGNIIWTTRISPGVSTDAIALDIGCSSTGDVYVFGQYGYFLGGAPPDPTNGAITIYNSNGTPYYYTGTISIPPASQNQSANTDAFLIKYNSAGFVQWTTKMGQIISLPPDNFLSNVDIYNYIAVGYLRLGNLEIDSEGNIILAISYGQTNFTAYNAPGLISTLTPLNAVGTVFNTLIIKYNSSGVAQWTTRILIDNNPGLGSALTIDPTNNIYLTGRYTTLTEVYDAPGTLLSDVSIPPSSLEGIDWQTVESTRNWKSIACDVSGDKLVAVVSTGQIYTSTDSGVNWTARESARNWFSVASDASGANLVAVVYGGQIYTSTDSGVNWIPRESNRNWNSVASNSTGSRLVASVDAGRIYYSTNSGVTWTVSTNPPTPQNWLTVSMSKFGLNVVAVTSTADKIYRSTDGGINFFTLVNCPIQNWGGVATNSDGSVIVGVVNGGFVFQSVDSGVTWATRYFAQILDWNYIYCNNNETTITDARFIASVDNGQIYISLDKGTTWNPTNNRRPWTCVACNGSFNKLFGTVSNQPIQIGKFNTRNTNTFLVKYNSIGQCQWITYCQGGINQGLSCVYNPSNQSISLAGLYNSTLNVYDSTNFTVKTATITGGNNTITSFNAFITNYSSDGLVLWENKITAAVNPNLSLINCLGILIDPVGNLYIGGTMSQADGLNFYNSTGELATTLPVGFNVTRLFCAKYYSNGVLQSLSYMESTPPSLNILKDLVYSTNNIVLVGNFNKNTTIYNSDNTLYTTLSLLNAPNIYSTFIVAFESSNTPSFVVNPPAYNNPYEVEFSVGGGSKSLVENYPVDNPIEIWGGQTGFTSGAVTLADLNAGVNCYYGHDLGNTRLFVSGLPSTSSSLFRFLALGLTEPSFPVNDNQPETPSSVIYGYLPIYIQVPTYATGVVFNTQLYNTSKLIMRTTGTVINNQVFQGISVGDVIRLVIIDPLTTGRYITLTVKSFIRSDTSVLPNIQAGVEFEESTYYAGTRLTPISAGVPRQTYAALLPGNLLPAFYQPKVVESGRLNVLLKLYHKYTN